MSIGPPALGNVLVQRLDAVLGTTMAAHANLVTGARPDAVSQPGQPDRPGQSPNSTGESGKAVDPAGGKAGGQAAVTDAKTAAALALAARGLVTRNDLTASAPTTLGQTARTILALLAQYPDKAPPATGRAPLWTPPNLSGAADGGAAATVARGGTGQQAAAAAQTAQSADNAADPARNAAGRQPAGQGAPEALLAASRAAALRASTMPQPAQLVQALRSAMQQTGLFYESHLAQMVFGQRTPAQLASEPQATLQPHVPADAPSAQGAGRAGTAAWAGGGTTHVAGDTASPSSPTSLSASLTQAGGNPLASLHPDATLLVRQQLDVLANQAFSWQGQPWPGATMEWEVERDRTATGADVEDDAHWATRIKLDLPRLGLVEARLNLAGNQLILHLVAPRSADELGQHSETLRQRLDAAGLTLSQISVDALPPSLFPPVEP